MPPPQYFSKNKDKILIELVRMNPVLFDDGHENFRDKVLKHVIWENISAAIDVPIPVVKKRWRHFRDHYLKKCREGALENPGKKPWEHFERLDFLKFLHLGRQQKQLEKARSPVQTPESIVYVVPPGEHDSFSEPEDAEPPDKILRTNSETVEIRSSPSPPAGASMLRISEPYSEAPQCPQYTSFSPLLLPEERSAVHKFFESMADIVVRFPPALVAEARLKVCSIVNDLETKAQADIGCPRCQPSSSQL